MKKRLSEIGFSVFYLLAALVVIAVIGIVAWKVFAKKPGTMESSSNSQTTQNTQQVPKQELATYKNDKARITFQYPTTWKSESQDLVNPNDGSYDGTKGSITSPSGNKLVWNYVFVGGGGGQCEPLPSDQPFHPGNDCPSKQIISVEKVQTIKNPSNAPGDIFQDSMFITKTKYLSNASGEKESFQICLDPYFTSTTNGHTDMTPTPETVMGFLAPCEFFKIGFGANFSVNSEADFNSPDAKTAEQIMKTFNSY